MVKIPRRFGEVRPTAGITSDRVTHEVSKSGQLAAQAEITKGQVGVEQAKSIGDIGKALGEIGEHYVKRLEADYLVNQSLEFQKQSMDHFNQSASNMAPYGEGFADGINEWHQTQAQAILDKAPTPEAALKMQQRLGQFSLRQGQRAFGVQQEASLNQTKLNYSNTINTLANQVFNSPEDAETYLQQAKEGLKGSSLDATTQQALTTQAHQQIRFNQVKGFIARDPVQALTDITEGKYNDLDNGNLISLTREAAHGIKQRLKQDKQELKNIELRAFYHSPAPLDPNSKRAKQAVDLVFEENIIPNLPDDPIEGTNTIMDFLKKKPGVLPTKVKEMFNGAIINGSPQQKELWSRLLVRMDKDGALRPMLDQIDKKAKSEAIEIVHQLDMGKNIEDAETIVRDQIRVKNDKEREGREVLLRETGALNDVNVLENIRDEFDVEDVSPVISEYKRAYKKHFLENKGSPESAHKFAMSEVRRYSVSEVNGESELMKDAPEVLFPGKSRDIREKLYKALDPEFNSKPAEEAFKEAFDSPTPFLPEPPSAMTDTIKVGDKEIVPKIKATDMTGKTGEYAIMYDDPLTGRVPLLDENFQPMFFKYDPGVSQEQVERQNMVESFKRKRDKINQSIKDAGTLIKDNLENLVEGRGMHTSQLQELRNMVEEFLNGEQEIH